MDDILALDSNSYEPKPVSTKMFSGKKPELELRVQSLSHILVADWQSLFHPWSSFPPLK